MSQTFTETIQELVKAAQRDNVDPIQYVQDYMIETDNRCTRQYAQWLIDRHAPQEKTS